MRRCSRRPVVGHVTARDLLGGQLEPGRKRHLDTPVQPAARFASAAGGRVQATGVGRLEALRTACRAISSAPRSTAGHRRRASSGRWPGSESGRRSRARMGARSTAGTGSRRGSFRPAGSRGSRRLLPSNRLLLGKAQLASTPVKTVLFVGAGRHQRRAIEQARARGLRVAAVDRNSDAPGLAVADVAEVVDFMDVAEVVAVARRIGVDGVLTVSADRAVPVVAAVAEELGLPGIGTETAHRLTHKLAMRRALADARACHSRRSRAFAPPSDIDAALEAVRLPAVLKPVDSGGQRAVFRIESRDELERDLEEAIVESPTSEAILEEFVDGVEMNGIVIARGGEPALVTLSDRLRPPGIGFGVGWIHVYPPSINGRAAATRRARRSRVGARSRSSRRDRVPAADRVTRRWRRRRGGRRANPRRADGRPRPPCRRRRPRRGRSPAGARREAVPDDVALPRFTQPLAIRFFTAQPGPLPTGEVLRIGSLDPVLAAEGVVQADTYLQVGETIRPVRRDGDRRGYVIADGGYPGRSATPSRARRDAAHGRGRGVRRPCPAPGFMRVPRTSLAVPGRRAQHSRVPARRAWCRERRQAAAEAGFLEPEPTASDVPASASAPMSCRSTSGTTARSSRRRRPAAIASSRSDEAPSAATSSSATTSTSRSTLRSRWPSSRPSSASWRRTCS